MNKFPKVIYVSQDLAVHKNVVDLALSDVNQKFTYAVYQLVGVKNGEVVVEDTTGRSK